MRTFFVWVGFLLTIASARAAHTQARLVLGDDIAQPGETVLAGVHLKMEPGWHTYWKNPGEAGMATKIQWQLPEGVTAGEIQWPLPHKLPPADVTTYGYEDELVLLVPLKLAADVKPGALALSAKVSWLECKDQCIPGDGSVKATLNVGAETKVSADAALLKDWQSKMPRTDKLFSFKVHWDKQVDDETRTLIFEGSQVLADKSLLIEKADFFPQTNDDFEIQGAVEKLPVSSGFAFRKTVKKIEKWPARISGVMVLEGKDQRNGFELDEPITGDLKAASASAGTAKSLGQMLLYAFIGGLILNIMPCVLPVIALKILSFVGDARNNPGRVRKLGIVYTLGVLASFLALAAVVIGLKTAGHKAGWGLQFSNPHFVTALTVLVFLVALNLFGIFEVTLGGRAMGAAGELASKHGVAGAFFNGILATVLATPCTAPFLSIALGFAFAQSSTIILMVFLSVGIGLALPYLVLSFQPAWLKFLPKPGAWMEKFKILMGFPMLATGVWLLTLASGSSEKGTILSLGLFLVALAMSAWIWGEFVQRGTKRRSLAAAAGLLVLVAGGVFAFPSNRGEQIQWQPWSSAAVAQAQAEGHPVLVDFTADWCLTCQVNKKVAIEVPSVRDKLKQIGAVNLIGDYTLQPAAMTDELARYQRAGVPLVLVFPGKPNAEPVVLPEVLTSGIILSALDQAAK
jgi:thiol:disulfide interchange protein DsbD